MSTPPKRALDLRQVVSGHMPVMDGWRGVAILVVVIHNAGSVLHGGASLPVALTSVVLTSGWVGVQLFFVLSGFLITGILLDTRGAPDYFRRFYVRRTLRIFPLYYGFLALALLVIPAVASPSSAWVESVNTDGIWYWLYLSNWTPLLNAGIDGLQHLWSLGVEEQFYLVWPALVVLSGRRFPLVALLIVLAAPTSRVLMYLAGTDPDYLYHFTTARADAFAVGALLAVTARRPAWSAQLREYLVPVLGVVTVGLLGVVAMGRGFQQYEPSVLLAGQSLISLWFGALMFSTLSPASRGEAALERVLSSRWLRTLGKYSYAMYVLHFPLHALARTEVAAFVDAAPPGVQILATSVYALGILTLSTGLAVVSWHLWEKHFLRLKERLAPRAAV